MIGVKTNIVVLPSDYHLLNYIQSKDCKCYIETGVTNENATIEMRFTVISDGSRDCLWCSRTGIEINTFSAFLEGGNFRYDLGSSKKNTGWRYKNNTDYVIKADNGHFWVNGQEVVDIEPSVFTQYNYITLLDSRSGSGAPSLRPSGNANIKLKGCRIYKGGQLVRDFVPVLKSEGVAGLLDTVNSKFYASPNGAAFNYG